MLTAAPSPEALLIALILAPGTFSRNKFFEMFQDESRAYARRRSQIVRSIVKELTEPWPHPGGLPPHPTPTITLIEELENGLRLDYAVCEFNYRRSVVLSTVEAAALRYALKQARCELLGNLRGEDRDLVESHLASLSPIDR